MSCLCHQRIIILSELGLTVQTCLTRDLIAFAAVAVTATATTATARLVITPLGLTSSYR